MAKVFLGGTCNESTWRNEVISKLTIDYFNPVVPDWTEDCQKEEIKQRQSCDFCLYVITPSMKGVYSIAEAVEDSIKRPISTVFCYTNYDGKKFSKEQIKSLKQVGIMIENNGAKSFNNLDDVCMYLNKKSGWKNPFSK